jgi:hypothetical protein
LRYFWYIKLGGNLGETGARFENGGSAAGYLLATIGIWALMLAQGGV